MRLPKMNQEVANGWDVELPMVEIHFEEFCLTMPEVEVQPFLRTIKNTPAKRVHVDKPPYPEIPGRVDQNAP